MRTITLEPVLDESPIVIVDGDGTVLDCNLAWTKLVATKRRTGLRSSLFDVVSFVGASVSPTAAARELQVHHIMLRDVDPAVTGGVLTTALLVPIVHRRRDTYLCVLLSPRLFHPDAVRFAELLALDASVAARADGAPGASAAAEAEPAELALPIEIEGCLRGALRLAAMVAGVEACAPGDLARAVSDGLRAGIPGRRVLVALRQTEPLGAPSGMLLAGADPETEPTWRPGPVGLGPFPGASRPVADAADPAGAAVAAVAASDTVLAREVSLGALPAWLQREFAGGIPGGGAPRFVLAEAPGPAGAAGLIVVGPWRGNEVLAPDERLLIDLGALLLAHRLAAGGRERELRAEVGRLHHALRAERAALGRTAERLEPVALSPAMAAALERGRVLEGLGRSYAICGPAGAGRRTMARYLAAIGPRRDAPLVEVGCRFHDERWLREELFGARATGGEDGASSSPGKVELAAGGTLMIGDLDELPPPLQAELLEGLRALGGPAAGSPRGQPAVLVATMGRTPEAAAQAGRLHPDLAALFGARTVAVPPLSERVEDVPALAARFVDAAAGELGRSPPVLTPRAVDRLRALPWPGHVRELKAAIEGAVALAGGGAIDVDLLPGELGAGESATASLPAPGIDLSVSFAELKQRWIDHFERAYLDAALRRSAGNLSAAARLARMDKKNFHAKATRLGLAGVARRSGAPPAGEPKRPLQPRGKRRSIRPPGGET